MRVLVADDELVARKRIVRLLASIAGITVVGECESGDAVVDRVKVGDVDVILLDIQMPGLSGIEAAELLPVGGPLVILCTAHPDHAVDAFEQGAVDYVMKPIEAGRLRKALMRAQERLSVRRPTTRPRHNDRPLARLAVATRGGIVLLDPRHVSHALLEGELVTIVADSGSYLSAEALSDLQERLPRELFERVHRRALLNLEHVVRLEPLETGGFVAHTRAGHAIEVSRQSARELRKRLGLGSSLPTR
jgi:two-component system LytT family response regulator